MGEGSRETPRTLARAGRWLRSRARSGRREMSRSRVSALSGVARWAAHLLLVGLALPALAVHAGTRMPPVSDGSLRLRGGAQELKIEHRAFVANLPKTITDKGLREAFAPFGKIKQARVLKDIETGQSRRMGYVTFEDATRSLKPSKICMKRNSALRRCRRARASPRYVQSCTCLRPSRKSRHGEKLGICSLLFTPVRKQLAPGK